MLDVNANGIFCLINFNGNCFFINCHLSISGRLIDLVVILILSPENIFGLWFVFVSNIPN